MLKKANNCEKLRETRALSAQPGYKIDLPASLLQNWDGITLYEPVS